VRAIVLEDIDKVAIHELAVPRPGSNEVLVRVEASSVNGFDLAVVAGGLKGLVEYDFPITLGKDFAGVVESVGDGVTEFAAGDAVFGFLPGMALGGAFAEFAVVPAEVALVPKPDRLDAAHAGALALAGSAAVIAVDAIAPSKGDRVLVVGAAGGVGSFVVQLAAAAGAHVIATTRTGDDADYLRDLGAAEVLNPGDPDPEHVQGLVDLLFHPDGAETLHALAAPNGRVASATNSADIEGLAAKGITATNIMSPGDRAVLDRLRALVDQGTLRVPLSTSFTLDQGPAALAAQAEHKQGKIGLSIAGA
jgi:NADPH:quinone reductase-like Zn-dependent oxidoreductase